MSIATDSRVARLTTVDDEAFVREAYLLVLGRSPDAEGRAFYLARLAAGAPRGELLAELARSEEGRVHLASAPAVEQALAAAAGLKAAAARSVQDLLALPDVPFVEQSSTLLLDPEAAASARLTMLAEVRSGRARERILADLAASSTAERVACIEGLSSLLQTLAHGVLPTPESVQGLFHYQDVDFIECAYRTILRRPPDFSGLAHYVGQLRAGWSRTSVLNGLARSSEAQAAASRVEGLAKLCRRYRWAHLPGLRWLLPALLRAESDTPNARRQRVIDWLAAQQAWAASPGGGRSDTVRPELGNATQAELMARQDALLEIQRDNFDRELNAIRRQLARLLEAQADTRPNARRLRPPVRRNPHRF